MKPTETVQLTTYISEGCPQQAISEFTADVWHDLLGEYDLPECIAAARKVMTERPFVAPCEIIAEVRRDRRARLGRVRREQLERQAPQAAIAAGRDRRLPREEIDRIFASVVSRSGVRQAAPEAPPERMSAGDIEAEKRRQLAALEVLISQEPTS
jgi:hypothetical protein